MKRYREKILIGILASAVLAAGALFACKNSGKKQEPISGDAYLLDTFCTVTIYEGGSQELLSEALERIRFYDTLFNAESEDSDIFRINHRKDTDLASSGSFVMIAPETAEMLKRAREIEELSEGALRITIRPVSELWDFKTAKKLPDEKILKKALTDSKEASWHLEGSEEEPLFAAETEGTRIEVGAFAKGYIADRIRQFLKEGGVKSAIIDLGGNIHTIGGKTDGSPFRIGIRDPKGEKSYLRSIEVRDLSVVTAGNYERFFEIDGVRYHHILDPETGYSAETGLDSVTVTGEESVLCDALATACFVKGTAEGMCLIDTFNEIHGTDYKGYFLSSDGGFTETGTEGTGDQL